MSLSGKPTSHYGQSDWEQYRAHRISFISKNYDILPGCTVFENVISALILNGMDRALAKERAEEILLRVELADKKKRRAAKLSSGQKQRLSIARALAKLAPILIADEPTCSSASAWWRSTSFWGYRKGNFLGFLPWKVFCLPFAACCQPLFLPGQ